MTKNNGVNIREIYGDKATVRELYTLVEDVRKEMATNTQFMLKEMNEKFEDIKNNELQHLSTRIDNLETSLSDRIATLEKKVYFASGGLAMLILILKFIIK